MLTEACRNYVAVLERQKAEVVADLRAASARAMASEWGRDRVEELAWINGELVRLGRAPAHVVAAMA